MKNMTNDRLHTNGEKALYPTFVNVGEKEALAGDQELFIVQFKAKRDFSFDLKAKDGILVGKDLEVLKL